MKQMPGIMSRMLPLPVSVNDDLASRLFSSTTQVNKFCCNGSKSLSDALENYCGDGKKKLIKGLSVTFYNQSFMTLEVLKSFI